MGRQATHRTCEEYDRLDVRELARWGILNGSSTVTWTRGKRSTSAISVCRDGENLRLSYVTKGIEVDERVPLDETSVNFGGKRTWFRCPGCDRRVAILYGGKLFRCRRCHALRYASQRETPRFRAISKIQRVRKKLGGSGNLLEPCPVRPRSMHRRTYRKLVGDEEDAWRSYGLMTPQKVFGTK